MAFGGFSEGGPASPMSEINTTPLVDVMLVLLIIFIITAPLMTHAVKIDLPEASSTPNPEPPDAITLAVDAYGKLYWNDAPILDQELPVRLQRIAAQQPQPELHLRAEKTTPYQKLAEVMSSAQAAGIARLGFVTEPVMP